MAHHVALCNSKIHAAPAQLGALLCIMSPPVWSRVAHVVRRRGGGLEAEVAQECAAISLPLEVGVDIRLAVRAAQGPRLPKVSHLQMSRETEASMVSSVTLRVSPHRPTSAFGAAPDPWAGHLCKMRGLRARLSAAVWPAQASLACQSRPMHIH